MRHFVDLHTHSTASDGDCAPAEVVRLAEGRRLAAVAMTDHDTTAGLVAAAEAASEAAVRFVPGVEISARSPSGLLHIVGLGIDPRQETFARSLRRISDARRQRNPKMMAKLRKLGFDVSMDDLRALAGESESLGRLHMARLLCMKGYVKTTEHAFREYLGKDGPAFVDKERLEPAEAFDAIHAAGGLAILAHPVHLGCANSAQLERVVRGFVHDGLDGIEVFHSDHSVLWTRICLDLAKKLGLLISGGSDFHGRGKPEVRIGRPRTPVKAVEQLLAKLGL